MTQSIIPKKPHLRRINMRGTTKATVNYGTLITLTKATMNYGTIITLPKNEKRQLSTLLKINLTQPTNHNTTSLLKQAVGETLSQTSQPMDKNKNLHENRQPTGCNICQCTNHWATQCPDKNMNDVSYMVHEIILQSSNDLLSHVPLSETLWFALFDEYIKNVSKEDKSKVLLKESSKSFRFNDRKKSVRSTAAIITTNIDQHKVSIKTYIRD